MADYDPIVAAAAKKNGIPLNLFKALGRQEGGVGQDGSINHSSAGAIGWGQLMPDTAKGLGVDPYNPVQNVNGAARYLKQQYDRFGSWRLALAAYNAGPGRIAGGAWTKIPETTNYVRNILKMAGSLADGAEPGGNAPAAAASPTLGVPSMPSAPDTTVPDLIARNLGSGLSAKDQLNSLVAAVAASPPAPAAASIPLPQPVIPGRPVAAPKGGKWVTVAKGADRAGASIQQPVLQFVGQVARVYGKPLTIGTGTNHNQYVVNSHRESAHWTGFAADIPASGAALTRLGQSALVAAGADPKWAARQKGGLFNIGGYQVIFNTRTGGNHFNHLHVGVRRG